jgi:hypothetical protein
VVNIWNAAHGSSSQANVDSASMNGPLMLAGLVSTYLSSQALQCMERRSIVHNSEKL